MCYRPTYRPLIPKKLGIHPAGGTTTKKKKKARGGDVRPTYRPLIPNKSGIHPAGGTTTKRKGWHGVGHPHYAMPRLAPKTRDGTTIYTPPRQPIEAGFFAPWVGGRVSLPFLNNSKSLLQFSKNLKLS